MLKEVIKTYMNINEHIIKAVSDLIATHMEYYKITGKSDEFIRDVAPMVQMKKDCQERLKELKEKLEIEETNEVIDG